jgi:ATP-dependent DNA helicase RecQ
VRCPRCDTPQALNVPVCPSCGTLSEEPPPHEEDLSPKAPVQHTQQTELAAEHPTIYPEPVANTELPTDLETYRVLLRERFGYPEFRPGQAEVLEQLAKYDVLGVMPTGGGKSLCYVLPAIEIGRTLVISPLIALMQDQVEALEATGIPASFINSTIDRGEQDRRYREFVAGHIPLLFVAPERLTNPRFLKALPAQGVRLLVVDEAHCISEWGHDFRPDYLALGAAREQLGRPRTLALTATADPTVRADILTKLGIADSSEEVITSFDRPNLQFEVVQLNSISERLEWLVSYIRKNRGQSGIVYARTRRLVEETVEALKAAGVDASGYHAGMSSAIRTTVQRQFTTGGSPLIVATNAFGLGIDKPDVRFVVHLQMPGRLEAYYQEAGRAGRDGEPAECTLLYARRDHALQRRFIDQAHPNDETVHQVWQRLVSIQKIDPGRAISFDEIEDAGGGAWAVATFRGSNLLEKDVYRLRSLNPEATSDTSVIKERRRHAESRLAQMAEYAETSGCRRSLILRYFGETVRESEAGCGGCDNCDGVATPQVPDYPLDLFESILLLRDHLARDSNRAPYMIFEERTAREIATYRPTNESSLLKTWGVGARRAQWFGEKLLALVRTWEQAHPEAPVPPSRPPSTRRQRSTVADSGPEIPFDNPLFQRLRNWRRERAQHEGVPAYTLFTDRTARELVSLRPTDRAGLGNVWGLGDARIESIGDDLLELLRNTDPPTAG